LTIFIQGAKAVTLHICGKTNKIWELMAEAGADCISIDNDASLLEAKQKIGQKVRLMGNVNLPRPCFRERFPTFKKKPFLSAYVRLMTTRKAILWLQDAAFPQTHLLVIFMQ